MTAISREPTTMPSENLITYLSDHMAASTAAVELLGNLKAVADEKHAAELDALRAEIEKDREVLRLILHDAGGEESVIKKAGAWVAEKLALGKFKIENFNAGSLGEYEALEMLSLGIAGKAGLWQALTVIGRAASTAAGADEGLGSDAQDIPDLQTLLWRAERQREIVETWRIAKAREIFC